MNVLLVGVGLSGAVIRQRAAYRYLDMDVTIRMALDTAAEFLECQAAGKAMSAFAAPCE